MDKSVHSFSLTPAQRRRLEKLAREAGRTPRAMFRFVLRDGFEQCEEDVRAAAAADTEAASVGTVPHARVMEEARAVVARHARAPRRKAA